MPSANQSAAMKVYVRILGEARFRLELLERLLQGAVPLPAISIREFSFLQLRMLCELIALGCLAAHGDIAGTHARKFTKEYSADTIVDELEKLHQMFFPVPMTQTITASGGKHFEAQRDSGSLTRDELPTLYGRCGDVLHKGTIKKLTSLEREADNSDVAAWTTKIHRLLSVHIIYLIDGNSYMIGYLRGKNGKAAVAFGEAVSSS
jgi:hypothetical protein